MKTLKVFQVKNANEIIKRFKMTGASSDDTKALFRFYRETHPTMETIDALVKEAIEKLNGEAISVIELNKVINDALSDELMRDIDITPFTLSEETQEIIVRLSDVEWGDVQAVLALVREEK